MMDQTGLPGSPVQIENGGRPKKNTLALVVLGLCAIAFAALSAYGLWSGMRARSSLSKVEEKAYKQGQADQKKADDDYYSQQNQTPFRSYVAPDVFGGFVIRFPKNWSGQVTENEAGSPQVQLILNPDFIKQVSNQDNVYAARISLLRTNYEQMVRQRQSEVKTGKLKQQNLAVSGIASTSFEGKFDSKHDGMTVLVPVRDKTLVIATDDKKYLPELRQILAQSEIIP